MEYSSFNAKKILNVAFLGITFCASLGSVGHTHAGGLRDTSFGNGTGRAVTDFGTYDEATAIAVQADGKIISGGITNSGGKYNFALARHNMDGSPDTSFGMAGTVVTPFSAEGEDKINAIAIQTDGKIVVAGATRPISGYSDVAIARYNADGSLDSGFGTRGKVIFSAPYADAAHAIAIQADGKIIVAGYTQTKVWDGTAGSYEAHDFLGLRYHPNGTPDTTFGTGGKVTTNFGGATDSRDIAEAMVIQADGKIVLAGGEDAFLFARYNTNGSLDTSFGIGGRASINVPVRNAFQSYPHAYGLTLQKDGKLVATGTVIIQGCTTNGGGSCHNPVAVARLNTNGTLDTRFGDKGTMTTVVSDSTTYTTTQYYASSGRGVIIQGDGKIVVGGGGSIINSGWDKSDSLVIRYTSGGILDRSFGVDGVVLDNVAGGPYDEFNAIAQQADGRIIAAGGMSQFQETAGVSNTDFTLVRYLP